MPFAMLGLLTCILPVLILRSKGPAFLFAPLFAVIAWNWWILLTMAYRVVLTDGGFLERVALARRVRTLPEDIREIGPDCTGQIGFFRVKYVGGKGRSINQITRFHEVILHIKSRNPLVVLKGC